MCSLVEERLSEAVWLVMASLQPLPHPGCSSQGHAAPGGAAREGSGRSQERRQTLRMTKQKSAWRQCQDLLGLPLRAKGPNSTLTKSEFSAGLFQQSRLLAISLSGVPRSYIFQQQNLPAAQAVHA